MELLAPIPASNVDLEQFSGNPPFLAWLAAMRTGDLERIILPLVQHGERVGVKTPQQALDHLAAVSEDSSPGKGVIGLAASDFKDSSSMGKELLKLDAALGVSHDAKPNPFHEIGRKVHQIVYGLWTGKLIPSEIKQIYSPPVQLGLFERPRQEKTREMPELLLFRDPPVVDRPWTSGLLGEVAECWQGLACRLGSQHWWEDYYNLSDHEIGQMHGLLRPIFGSALAPLYEYDRKDAYSRYISFLTMMILATAAIHTGRTGRRALMGEIPLLAKKYGLGAWRLDLLVVTEINGQPPTEEQMRIIDRMARQRYASVAHVLRVLRKLFGPYVRVRIDEVKSALGDHTEWGQIIGVEQFTQSPLLPHEIQAKMYRIFAELGMHLMHGDAELWQEGDSPFLEDPQLIYFSATQLPVTHHLHMNGVERQALFMREIVEKFRGAELKAMARSLNHVLVGHVVDVVNDGKNGHKPRSRNNQGQIPDDPVLFPEAQPHLLVREVIDRSRTYLDQDHIIEIKGDGSYQMHVDVLLQKIETGDVQTGRFGEHDGGHISCLMPNHKERTPSMMVYLNRGHAHCFGCRTKIKFAPGSVPSHIRTQERKRLGRINKGQAVADYSFDDLNVPSEHFRIMELVQNVFRKSLRGSNGEKYLHKRRIDLDLALSSGVGFSTNTSVQELIDTIGFDGCVHYGLIGFSPALNAAQGLCPLLKGHGMALREIVKEKKVKGQTITTFPYWILGYRVTFPLSYGQSLITNFYGRSILPNCPSHLKHRKLLVAHTGVPHGMYPSEILNSPSSLVVVCEGVFDARTLIQCGYSAVAVIGVENFLILEAILKSGKTEIGIALDNDKAGREATEATLQWIAGRGYPVHAFNFTADFIAKNPAAGEHDDYGTWWVESGYRDFNLT